MTSTALFGWTNHVKTGSVAANSAAANFPVGNLQNDQGAPSEGWQTTITSGIILTVTSALTQQSWGAVGLFRTNLTSAASVTFGLYTNPSTLMWTATVAGPVGGSGQVVAYTGGVVADYLLAVINDPGNPDGFVNVPLAFAGPVWNPIANFSFASSFGRDRMTDELASRGGQEFPVLRYQRRRWDLDLQSVRESEAWASLDALNEAAAAGGNVLVVPDYTSANLGYQALLGRLSALADLTYPFGSADRRAWKARVTERL